MVSLHQGLRGRPEEDSPRPRLSLRATHGKVSSALESRRKNRTNPKSRASLIEVTRSLMTHPHFRQNLYSNVLVLTLCFRLAHGQKSHMRAEVHLRSARAREGRTRLFKASFFTTTQRHNLAARRAPRRSSDSGSGNGSWRRRALNASGSTDRICEI